MTTKHEAPILGHPLPNLLAAAFGIVLSTPSLGLACSCLGLTSPQAALAAATEVFSGRVTAVDDPHAAAVIRSSMDPLTVTLTVDRVWKGAIGPVAKVVTASSEASCGFSFRTNESYLVYAHRSHVSLCSATKVLAAASQDLAALGAGQGPSSNPKEPSLGHPATPAPSR